MIDTKKAPWNRAIAMCGAETNAMGFPNEMGEILGCHLLAYSIERLTKAAFSTVVEELFELHGVTDDERKYLLAECGQVLRRSLECAEGSQKPTSWIVYEEEANV